MASILARNWCRSARYAQAIQATLPQRTLLHSTSVVHKKKSNVAIDDLFADDAFADDLIAPPEIKKPARVYKNGFVPGQKPVREKNIAGPKLAKMIAARKQTDRLARERLAKLKSHLAFVKPRIGKPPKRAAALKEGEENAASENASEQEGSDGVKGESASAKKETLGPTRKGVWKTMLQLAATEEELGMIVALMPDYVAGGGEYPIGFAEDFARRCHELKCPHYALTVFGDFAKYQVALNLLGAQWLLHSLYVEHSIEKVLIAASLYPVYNLPQISEDLPSAAMVAAACVRHQSRLLGVASRIERTTKAPPPPLTQAQKDQAQRAKDVVQGLLPPIKKMMQDANGPEGGLSTAATQNEAMLNKWIGWAVHRVNKAVKRETGEWFIPDEWIPKKVSVKPAVLDALTEAPDVHINVRA